MIILWRVYKIAVGCSKRLLPRKVLHQAVKCSERTVTKGNLTAYLIRIGSTHFDLALFSTPPPFTDVQWCMLGSYGPTTISEGAAAHGT